MGTNHVDNSARLCHAASTSAMQCDARLWRRHVQLRGLAPCGSHRPVRIERAEQPAGHDQVPASREAERRADRGRQPLSRAGTGSLLDSVDRAKRAVRDRAGGPLVRRRTPAAISLSCSGVLRALIERGGVDEAFVRDRTTDFDLARAVAAGRELGRDRAASGMPRERIEEFAQLLMDRPNAVFVWSMGLTQHVNGVETIKALMNVGLARGLPGRPNRGLVPIRGHSGVQGGAEVGCAPKVDAATAARWAEVWGFPVPQTPGWTAAEMVEHSARGEVDLFWMVGGNFLETLADADRSRAALRRPRLRIHQDIVLSSSMLVDGDGDVLLLPAATRYESPGGGCETSTERRIIFSPEIPGRRIGSARPEWWVFREVMTRIDPQRANLVGMSDAAAIRREIARAIPLYAGIETLVPEGRSGAVGRPDPLRGRALCNSGRTRALCGRAALGRAARATDLPGVNPARQAVQLDDPAGRRPVDRRPPRQRAHERR